MPEPFCDKMRELSDEATADALSRSDDRDAFVCGYSSGVAFAYRDAIYHLKIIHPQFALDDQCQPPCSTNTDAAASDKPQ